MESLRLGAVFPWKVVSVGPLEVLVQPHSRTVASKVNVRAVIHLTGAIDRVTALDDVESAVRGARGAVAPSDRAVVGPTHPFYGLSPGDKILARIVQLRGGDSRGGTTAPESLAVYLSLEGLVQPTGAVDGEAALAKRRRTESVDSVSSVLAVAGVDAKWTPMPQLWGKHAVRADSVYAAAVTKVEDTCCVVALSPYISARLHFFDISTDLSVATRYRQCCAVGQRVVVAVTGVINDSESGRPKAVTVSRLPVEKYGRDLGIAGAAGGPGTAKAAGKKQGKKAKPDVPEVPSTVDIAALNKVATQHPVRGLAMNVPEPGAVVTGILLLDLSQQRVRIPQPPAVLVSLGAGVFGRVCLTEVAEPSDWEDCSAVVAAAAAAAAAHSAGDAHGSPTAVLSGRRHGDLVECRVLSEVPVQSKVAADGAPGTGLRFFNLSLRPSRLVSAFHGHDDACTAFFSSLCLAFASAFHTSRSSSRQRL
jgi:hypothetical protein